MDIEKVKDMKQELEDKILNILNEFEIKTGACVHNIELQKVVGTGGLEEIYSVDIDLRI